MTPGGGGLYRSRSLKGLLETGLRRQGLVKAVGEETEGKEEKGEFMHVHDFRSGKT